MSVRHQAYITEARQASQKVWDGINALKGLQNEWNALDYGNTLVNGIDQNAGYTSAQVGSATFATADALQVVLDAGHGTNLASLL